MLELDQQAKDAGVTILNEIGLDPGIDHLYAVSVIERLYQSGGKTKSFVSYCGGSTAPEDLMGAAKPYHIYPGFAFVAYPNRDSTPHRERYNIPEAEIIIRGTLRYQGFPEFISVLVDTGFLSDEEESFLKEPISWKEVTQKMLGAASTDETDLLKTISSKPILGILSDSKITPNGNPLDTLCALLEQKMSYKQGERDFVLLQHKFEIENKDGTREVITSTLSEYGAPFGSSGPGAMARLVGTPSVKLVLDGTIDSRGIIAPLSGNINRPLMQELREKCGIECRERVIV
ncbi:hypothetical protein S40288_02679 [Stachybotrys chartarum IBT 40288]|nr:hypothetical protein S40288_02679 [Stachybotrys chartarum IBT 40288]